MVSFTNPSSRDMALFGVYMVVVIDIFASALTVPIMPFYVKRVCGCESMTDATCTDPVCNRLGGPSSALGSMFSAFAIAQLVSNAWMGPLSDKIGRRAILTITLGGACIGMLWSSLATTYTMLVVSRIFIGFCSGTMSTANAYIADISTPAERPALMANVGTLLQLCFMFGPGVGAGLGELDKRAPFWVGSFTSLIALTLAHLYVKPPEELFPDGLPGETPGPGTGGNGKGGGKEEKADGPPAKTDWALVGVLAVGSLGSNTAMSSLLTCQALYLHDVFGFESLQFGFFSMGTAVFSILVRTTFSQKVQKGLGLMKTASLGALMGSATYCGYSLLDGSAASLWIFFALAGVGTIGSTFSSTSVTPFFSQLGNRSNMGRIMSISSMTSSLGRVVGPPLFGALYAVNIRYPYRLAACCTLLACAVYLLVHLISAARTAARPDTPLAERDAARKSKAAQFQPDLAVAELQELLRATLEQRGYDLSNAAVVDMLKHILCDALPLKTEGRSDEEVLRAELDFVHEHWACVNREHADSHPHHA